MYIGIDLGGTNIKVGLVDSEGNILEKASIPTNATSTSEDIIKDMATLALQVIEQAGFTVNDVKSIGIGSPGTPDCENGMLIYTNNLPFRNTPIRAEIQKYINLPVHLNNDANCAALGEAYAGAAKDVHHS
ncbi:MAG: ROK family protein, partial [Hyphomonadaceae bacterium]|nr:ROK family protein [Clostridia bacterium]